MNTSAPWQPAPPSDRYRAIDILRGLALFGVLIVNVLTLFRVPLLEHILIPHSDLGRANRLVDILVEGALEFKAVTIFSFLFGAGVAIQTERAVAHRASARLFLIRRMFWLLLLGATHLFLIWNGDILTLYAICGMLVLPFLSLPWPASLVLGLAAILLPTFVPWGLPMHLASDALLRIADAREVYGNAGFLSILRFRWQETWTLIVPLLVAILPRTAGLMCWGAAAWRSGVLRDPGRYRGTLITALALAAPLGVTLTVNQVWAKETGLARWPGLWDASDAPPILLAVAYMSAFLLWTRPRRDGALRGVAAVGQMALTNYLIQSVVLGFIFYGYGFGLFGRIGSAWAACLSIALYGIQVRASRGWLNRFRFGPFEWLWRSLSYGQWQPWRRSVVSAQETVLKRVGPPPGVCDTRNAGGGLVSGPAGVIRAKDAAEDSEDRTQG